MDNYDSIALIAAERSNDAAHTSMQAANLSLVVAIIGLVGLVLGIVWYFVEKHISRMKLYHSVADKLALKMMYRNEDKPKFELVALSLVKMEPNERTRYLYDNGIADVIDFYKWVDRYAPGWLPFFKEYQVLKTNKLP